MGKLFVDGRCTVPEVGPTPAVSSAIQRRILGAHIVDFGGKARDMAAPALNNSVSPSDLAAADFDIPVCLNRANETPARKDLAKRA